MFSISYAIDPEKMRALSSMGHAHIALKVEIFTKEL